jgi:hypothetical protein
LLLSPLQRTWPLVLNTQSLYVPAETAVAPLAGGVDWPWELSPQHATVALVRMPHVWGFARMNLLVETAVKVPGGGVPSPYELYPQHTTAPLVFTPQL